jgi:hypothetical protein
MNLSGKWIDQLRQQTTGFALVVHLPHDIPHGLHRYLVKRQEHFFVVTLIGDHSINRVKIIVIGLVDGTVIALSECCHYLSSNASCPYFHAEIRY